MKKYFPKAPLNNYGVASFCHAKVVAEALRKARRDLTREKFVDALESLKNYDAGDGRIFDYRSGKRSGPVNAHMKAIKNGKFVKVMDWYEVQD